NVMLGAPREIDLPKTRLPEIEDASAERIRAPSWHLRNVTPVHQCREQVMASRHIERRAAGKFCECGLPARLRQRFKQAERAVDGLNAVARRRLQGLGLRCEDDRFGTGCNCIGHGVSLPVLVCGREKALKPGVKDFSIW